jgi:LPXTG-motif cell wall-anchored protein
MFDVRRFSPRLLTVLTVAGLGLLGLVATAAPASAHTGLVSRTCSTLTVHLTNFMASTKQPNVVTVTLKSAAGTTTDTVTFSSSSTDKTYSMAPNLAVNVHAHWDAKSTPDHVHGDLRADSPAQGDCAPPCAAKDAITYTFDGPAGTATVTVAGKNPLCKAVTVLLVSYKTQGPTWETSGHQTVFDQASQVIEKPGTYPLKVSLPDCNTQDDLYVTDRKPADFDFPNDTLGEFLASSVWHGMPSAWNGGKAGCDVAPVPPTPTPTATPTAVSPTSAAPPAAAPPGTSLPNTGASPMPKILLAIVLLGAGTGLAFLGRRRRRIS